MRRMHSASCSGLGNVVTGLKLNVNENGGNDSSLKHTFHEILPGPATINHRSVTRTFPNLLDSFVKNDTVGCTLCTRRPMAGDIQLTCSDCGQDFTFTAADQAFFQERGYSTPKRCKPCRMAKKNDQGGGGGGGYRSAPAQGTPVICSGCGQPTTVPFEPRADRPVFCRDCYQARKGSSGGGGGAARSRGRY